MKKQKRQERRRRGETIFLTPRKRSKKIIFIFQKKRTKPKPNQFETSLQKEKPQERKKTNKNLTLKFKGKKGPIQMMLYHNRVFGWGWKKEKNFSNLFYSRPIETSRNEIWRLILLDHDSCLGSFFLKALQEFTIARCERFTSCSR